MAKDRAKDLLAEMEKLRMQKEAEGSIDFSLIPDMELARRLARSLLGDAGLDIDDPDDVTVFLYMVALHLHGTFPTGSKSELPYDKFTLLEKAYDIYQIGIHTNKSPIAAELLNDRRLAQFNLNHVRMALTRALEDVFKEKLKLMPAQKDKLEQMMPALRAMTRPAQTLAAKRGRARS